MKLPIIKSYFSLTTSRDFDLEKLKVFFTKDPTEIRQKGDLLRGGRKALNSEVTFDNGEQETCYLNKSVFEALNLFIGDLSNFTKFIEDFEFQISIVSYIQVFEESCIFELKKETVNKLSDLNANWSMDYYDYSTYDEDGILKPYSE